MLRNPLIARLVSGAAILTILGVGAFNLAGPITRQHSRNPAIAQDPLTSPELGNQARDATAEALASLREANGNPPPAPATREPKPQKTKPKAAATAKPAPPRAGSSQAGRVVGNILHGLLLIAIALATVGSSIVASRLISRRRRDLIRWRIHLPRTDRPDFAHVVDLLQSWHRNIQPERWYRQLWFGSPHLGLEAHISPLDESRTEGSRRWSVELDIVCEPQRVEALDAQLSYCYPNARIGYQFDERPTGEWRTVTNTTRMVRLHKQRGSMFRAAAPNEGHSPARLDRAIKAAQVGSGTTTIQFRLTPTSRLAERMMRRRVARLEGDLEAERRREGTFAGPGLPGSVVRQRELDATVDMQYTSLFRGEIWIFGDQREAVDNAAGALQAAVGENPLNRRRVVSPLHRRRVQAAFPGFVSTDTYSAMEIAALWGLPSDLTHPAITRNSIPRLSPSEAVAVGQRGLGRVIGGQLRIRPDERRLGIQISGLQGVGKSSVMLSLFEEAAADDTQAVVLFDPKGRDLARAALGLVPIRRKNVYYLDLQNPMFGINPLEAEGTDESRISALIQGLIDMNDEGAIRNSSERFLHFAIEGATAIAKQKGIRPSMWLVSALLDPGRVELHRLAAECCRAEGLNTAQLFYGYELAEQLTKASSATTQKLDAPKNKIQSLLSGTVDAVLHHPVQISLDKVIEEHGVLIVDAGPGEVGEHARHKLLQMLFRLVFAAVQRQQALPEHQRTRVGLMIDEAHLVLTEAFHDMAATGRSAGVEIIAAFQGSEQFESPKVLLAVEDLLRNALVFSASQEDALRAQKMMSHTEVSTVRPDAESRGDVLLPADVFRYLPPFTAMASITCGNKRQPPFTLVTNPPSSDPRAARSHLRRLATLELQGGKPHCPADLGDLIGAMERLTSRPGAMAEESTAHTRSRTGTAHETEVTQADASEPDAPTLENPEDEHQTPESTRESVVVAATGDEGNDTPNFEPDPAACDEPEDAEDEAPESQPAGKDASDPKRVREEALAVMQGEQDALVPVEGYGGAATSLRVGAPDSFYDIDIEPMLPKAAPFKTVRAKKDWVTPQEKDVELVRLLTKANWVIGPQIAAWLGLQPRAVTNVVKRSGENGWIKRYRLDSTDGSWRYVYALTTVGFKAAAGLLELTGKAYALPDHAWSEQQEVRAPVVHDLRAAGWALAFATHATQKILRVWHGARSSVANPKVPQRSAGGGAGRRPIRLHEVEVPFGMLLQGVDRFTEFRADGVLDVLLGESPDGDRWRHDLFLELNNLTKPSQNKVKFSAYDAFLSAWGNELPRYNGGDGKAPRGKSVIFICRDEPQLRAMMRVADVTMTGRLASGRGGPHEWSYPGRVGAYFVTELDIHEGNFRAWQLPRLPPAQRKHVGETDQPQFTEVLFIDPILKQWAA